VKVLIVEDDLIVADLLEAGLLAAGLDVCGIARTVTSAVTLARLHHPTVAIVDIHLADADRGTDLPGRLAPTWPFAVLFASGIGHAAKLYDTGGTAILTKPYSAGDLVTALAVVGDIVATGSSARPLPAGMRLLAPH